MDINKLTATLRPRNGWEAIDLGFVLARQWFWPLCKIYACVLIPFYLLLLPLQLNEWIPDWLLGVVLWWLKPFFEKPLIIYASRALFGEQLSTRSCLSLAYRVSFKERIYFGIRYLGLHRLFMLGRSFEMSADILEGLNNQTRPARMQILKFNYSKARTWLLMVCLNFEFILYFGFLAFLFFITPSQWLQNFNFFIDLKNSPWLQIGNAVLFSLCTIIVAAFYVTAGFCLYISRRTELEAWDIQLEFSKINQRLEQKSLQHHSVISVLALSVVIFWCGAFPNTVIAQTESSAPTVASQSVSNAPLTPNSAQQDLKKVLAGDEYGKQASRYRWQLKDKVSDKTESDENWIRRFIKWLINLLANSSDKGKSQQSHDWTSMIRPFVWSLLLVLGAWLVWVSLRWARSQDWSTLTGPKKKQKLPSHLFGLELSEGSLPEQPIQQALHLAEQGHARESLSLLYRLSLVYLMQQEQLDIPISATENECLQEVTKHSSSSRSAFFETLTQNWLLLAYAHQTPSLDTLRALCQRCQEVFEPTIKGGQTL